MFDYLQGVREELVVHIMGAETSIDALSEGDAAVGAGGGGCGEDELAPQEWYRRERMELFLDPTHFFRRSRNKRKAKEEEAAAAAAATTAAAAAAVAAAAVGDGGEATNSKKKRRRSEQQANAAPAAPPALPSYNMLLLAFGQGLTRDRAVTLRKNIEDKLRSATQQGTEQAGRRCSLVAVSSTSWKAGKEEKQENERVSKVMLSSDWDPSEGSSSASPPLLVIIVDGGSSRVKLLERIQKVWLTAHGASASSPEARVGLIGRLSGLIRGGRIRV